MINDDDDDHNNNDILQAFQLTVLASYLTGNIFGKRQMADWSMQVFPSV